MKRMAQACALMAAALLSGCIIVPHRHGGYHHGHRHGHYHGTGYHGQVYGPVHAQPGRR